VHFKYYISVVLVIYRVLAFGQDKKTEAEFSKTCSEIVNAFAKKNIAGLNKYSNTNTGVYIISRPGAVSVFTRIKKFDDKTFFALKYPYRDTTAIKKHTITYASAPRFDCGDMKWDKMGFVADSSAGYKPITEIMDFREKYEHEKYTAEDVDKKNETEKRLRKVVYTHIAKNHGLVFYMSFIQGKWYLSIIDITAGSCGV
jgi:hypothetical protein